MTANLLKLDELNLILKQKIESLGISLHSATSVPYGTEKLRGELEDTILDYLIYAYVTGVESGADDLGEKSDVDVARMQEVIYAKTAGKSFSQRLSEEAKNGDFSNAGTVAETEYIRVVNEGILDSGKKHGAKTKTWQTMLDDRVRDTHEYLEGVTIPFGAEFYTYDGDHAPAPHQFNNAYNNVNCRCVLKLSK